MASNETLPVPVVIQFGNYCNRLVFVSLLDRGQHREFPLNTPFKVVLAFLREAWNASPFTAVCIQEPDTIDSLVREYHNYNHLIIPSDRAIHEKIVKAEKFYRYLTRQFTTVFPECQLIPVRPTIEDFIRHAGTGALLPPLGDLDPSEIHPRERAYVVQANSNKQKGDDNPLEIPTNELKYRYPVQKITCECCGDSIPCPLCGRRDLLRGWGAKARTVALCYGCGTLFFCDTGEIVAHFTSSRDSWGAQAIAHIASILKSM